MQPHKPIKRPYHLNVIDASFDMASSSMGRVSLGVDRLDMASDIEAVALVTYLGRAT
jgi:hypothetical protein